MNLLLKIELFKLLPEEITGSGYIFVSQKHVIERYVGRKSCKKQ